jgi:predicted RNA-binding protein Jag
MERFLSGLFNLAPADPRGQNEEEALQQTHRAIETILNGERWIELSPASSFIRRLQHQMARQANLYSYSYGKEPNRRVRIYRE